MESTRNTNKKKHHSLCAVSMNIFISMVVNSVNGLPCFICPRAVELHVLRHVRDTNINRSVPSSHHEMQ